MDSKEEFRDIPSPKGRYQISNHGRVKALSWKRTSIIGLAATLCSMAKDMPEKLLKIHEGKTPTKTNIFVVLKNSQSVIKGHTRYNVYDLLEQVFDKETAEKWFASKLKKETDNVAG